MRTVQVLLRDDVDNLGRCGDVVKVAAGYARNYLLPKRVAVQATADNIKMMARRRARLDIVLAEKLAEAQKRVDVLAAVKLSTSEKADEGGKLYGSVGAATIAKLLTDAGHPTDEKAVRLDAPIKETGSHTVAVHVHGELNAEVTLEVVAAD